MHVYCETVTRIDWYFVKTFTRRAQRNNSNSFNTATTEVELYVASFNL